MPNKRINTDNLLRCASQITGYAERYKRSSIDMEYTLHKAELGLEEECELVLRSLPEWFGIEESTKSYVESIRSLPTYTARINSKIIGFVSVAKHYVESAELYVLGVLAEYHHCGVGRALLSYVEEDLKEQGIIYVLVKTVSPEVDNEAYRKTYLFYRACGYSPLETIKDYWDPWNPCLFMVKSI